MARKLPDYPLIKKVLWRYLRVFAAAFIAKLSIDQFITGGRDIKLQVLEAAIAGGIAAIFKALREGKDYDATIHKLPF